MENWHRSKLSPEESDRYHERLLLQGNIITFCRKNVVLGYLEYWRINPEQLGRIILGIPIKTDVEDILTGPISYINNMWIDENYRNGEVFEMLSNMFLVKNRDAEFFVACRSLRNNKPMQVYTRQELIRLYSKGI